MDEFMCDDKKCIQRDWMCDGDDDCDGGEDERNCTLVEDNQCLDSEFQCKTLDRMCINKSWQCDGDPDCEDESDEKGCEFSSRTRTFFSLYKEVESNYIFIHQITYHESFKIIVYQSLSNISLLYFSFISLYYDFSIVLVFFLVFFF